MKAQIPHDTMMLSIKAVSFNNLTAYWLSHIISAVGTSSFLGWLVFKYLAYLTCCFMCYMFSKGVFCQRQEFSENKMFMSLLFTFVGHFRKPCRNWENSLSGFWKLSELGPWCFTLNSKSSHFEPAGDLKPQWFWKLQVFRHYSLVKLNYLYKD